MNVRDILKNAPNSVVIICGTVMALSVLGAYVFLAHSGKDAAEISRFVNTLLNFAMLLVGSVGAISASSAAKSSSEAKDAAQQAAQQTNGQLTTRDETIESLKAENQRLRGNSPDQPGLF